MSGSQHARGGTRGNAGRTVWRGVMMQGRARGVILGLGTVLLAALLTVGTVLAQARTFSFSMVRSGAVQTANCLPQASGQVTITSIGPVELLDLTVTGL